MIIDLHTQVWSNLEQLGSELAGRMRSRQMPSPGGGRWAQLDASGPAHEEATSCVDMSLVFGFRSERLEAHVPNEFIAEFVSQDPQRRAGVAGVDPMSANALDQLDAAIAMGFIGVNLSPACQGFHPMHSQAVAIYERCEESRMPVFFTLGDPIPASAMLEFARPVLLDEVARTFPDLRLVINQIGNPWIDETLALLSKHEHLYADVSGVATRQWQLYSALLGALHLGVMDKLLFASGFPRETPATVIEALYSVNGLGQGTNLPTVPRLQIRGIIERNAMDCLGLDLDLSTSNRTRDKSTSPQKMEPQMHADERR